MRTHKSSMRTHTCTAADASALLAVKAPLALAFAVGRRTEDDAQVCDVQILEAAEARKDTLEGAALPPLVRAIEAAWMQDAHARPGLEDL